MCGILGFVKGNKAKNNAELKDILRTLFLVSAIRGKDATGFAYVKEGDLVIKKAPVPAEVFIKEVEQLDISKIDILIGHTRQATQGNPNNPMNNHPIMSKATNLAIVHNGMVRSQKKVKTDGQVDSEEVLRLIEMKDNVIEGIKYAEENYTGVSAYAMIGANMPDALFLVRSGNPIMLCYVRELDIVLFASTREILQASLQEYKCYMNFFVEKRHKHEAVFQGMEDNSYLLISRAGGKLTFKSEKFEKKGGYFSSVPVRYKYDKSQGDWMCEVD